MFSNRIREARERQKMTQKMLSIRLGIAQTTVSGWENGSKRPSVDTIVQISDILGVSTDYLLDKTDSPVTVIRSDSTSQDVSPFERKIIDSYRSLSEIEQMMVCRSLGLTHPAEQRAKASRA